MPRSYILFRIRITVTQSCSVALFLYICVLFDDIYNDSHVVLRSLVILVAMMVFEEVGNTARAFSLRRMEGARKSELFS